MTHATELPMMSPIERADLEREAGYAFATNEDAHRYRMRKLNREEYTVPDLHDLGAALRLIDGVLNRLYDTPRTQWHQHVINLAIDDVEIARHLLLAEMREYE